jgi:multiple sugar transport system permease protein
MRRRPWQRLALGVLKTLAVLTILLWSLAPILLIVSSSLKPEGEIFAVPRTPFFTPTFGHYMALWHCWPDSFTALLNSGIVTALAAVIAVFASCWQVMLTPASAAVGWRDRPFC